MSVTLASIGSRWRARRLATMVPPTPPPTIMTCWGITLPPSSTQWALRATKRVYPCSGNAPINSCLAFCIQAGISLAEPGSLDNTASTPPTGSAFMPRISSISGPGQKLPRASISLSIVISFKSGMRTNSFLQENVNSEVGRPYSREGSPPHYNLDEQGEAALLGTLDEGGDAGDIGHNRLKVAQLHIEQLHGHAARVDFHLAHLHGALEVLHPGGDFLRHHLLHHDRGIVFKILADAHVGFIGILAECFQTPERDEQLDIQAHGGPTSGECGDGHQFIYGSRIDDDRHSIFHD